MNTLEDYKGLRRTGVKRLLLPGSLGEDGSIWQVTGPVELKGHVLLQVEMLEAALSILVPRDSYELTNGTVVDAVGVRAIWADGHEVKFSATEWRLLQYLLLEHDRVVPVRSLLTEVWGAEYINDLQYARTWVSRLRDKLNDTGNVREGANSAGRRVRLNKLHTGVIENFQGIGYVLNTRSGREGD